MSERPLYDLLVGEAPKSPEQHKLLTLLLVAHQNLMLMGHKMTEVHAYMKLSESKNKEFLPSLIPLPHTHTQKKNTLL